MNDISGHAPSIVAIGGGTGLSTMLRGLKHITKDITAIVTVADDGGGSGVLRRELGMPPPGDIRNCMVALANAEPALEKLMNYRFDAGTLRGQSFGNLAIAAMMGVYGSFRTAVAKLSDIMAITGAVLPVTDTDVKLAAELVSGRTVVGESLIGQAKKLMGENIRRVFLIPESPPATPECVGAIETADMIIIGPGSLYTSILPNLIVDGIPEAIMRSDAVKVYVSNLMTQDGETEGYTATDHIHTLFEHAGGRKIFDICLMNDRRIPEELRLRYAAEGAEPLYASRIMHEDPEVTVVSAPVASERADLVRHDPEALAGALMRIYLEHSPTRVYGG